MENNGVTRRWGHYASFIMCIVLFTVIALVRIVFPITVVLGMGSLLVGLVLVSWKFMRRHDRQLCEYCVKAMPLNAEKSADNNKLFLDLVHKSTVLIVSYLGLLLVLDFMMMSWNSNWMYVVWSVSHIPILAFMYAHMVHQRLQPWCRQCRNGGIEKRTEGKVMA